MNRVQYDAKDKCRKIFEDFAKTQGLIFEESYDPFYEDGWIIRFNNAATGKHWEHVFLNHPNSLYPTDSDIPSFCWIYISEAIKFLY